VEKRPLIDDWLNASSADANQITQWWTDHPDALIGLPMKHLDLLVIDCDRHSPDQDGVAAFNAIVAAHGELPAHPTIKTPNNGEHHVFRQPSDFKIGNKTFAPGIDTRGYKPENAGGYVIGAGSVLPDGRAWRPAKGTPLFLKTLANDLAGAPAWLIDKLREKEAPKALDPSPVTSRVVGRNEEAYAMKALDRIASELAGMPPNTGRDNALMSAAGTMGRMIKANWIGYATVEGRLVDACKSNKLIDEAGDAGIRDKIARAVDTVSAHEPLAERQGGNEEQTIAALAELSDITYQKRRIQEAKSLGVPVAALDKLVRQCRAQAEDDAAVLPHWTVEPWDAPVSGDELLTEIARIFARYIALPKGAGDALALWTLHAWTMDAGDISPFLVLVSPTKRCGKTSVLIILLFLTPRSELASNISSSAIFRYVEDIRPTLLIDEADTFVKGNEEMRGILNSGHTRAAANAIRNVEVNGEHKPRRFSTWAPKAIATIRSLADTLEDRSIVLLLQRKSKTAKVARLRRRDNDEFALARRKLARWTSDNFEALTDPDPKIPDELNDRAADNWRPLLAIADLAGGEWPERAREAAKLLSGESNDTAANVELLADIKLAFGDADEIRSADLVAKLTADPERPWAEWKNGKALTQKQLAGLLRPFGITSDTVHPTGLSHAKGYKRSRFQEAWDVYSPGQNALASQNLTSEACKRANTDGSKTTRDFSKRAEAFSHGPKNDDLAYSRSDLHACTDRKPEFGAEGDLTTKSHASGAGNGQADINAVAGEPEGRIVANGYAISGNPDDRREPEPGQIFARVTIREIRHPAISAGPHDDLEDFTA
jgi:putative DNA primase/helicase